MGRIDHFLLAFLAGSHSYPFRPPAVVAEAVTELAAACSALEPFMVTLAEFRFFRHHSTGHCTLWLAPEPGERLRAAFGRLAMNGVPPTMFCTSRDVYSQVEGVFDVAVNSASCAVPAGGWYQPITGGLPPSQSAPSRRSPYRKS